MSGAAELSPAAPGAAEPSTAVSGVAALEAPCPRPGTREPSRADLGASSEASVSSARSVWRLSTGFCPSPTPSTFSMEHVDYGASLSVFSAHEVRSQGSFSFPTTTAISEDLRLSDVEERLSALHGAPLWQ